MRMMLRLSSFLLVVLTFPVYAQDHSISLGIFTGVTSSYIWDEGVNRDPRYEIRYDVRFSPIGVAFGVDYEGFGFVVTPSAINVGQKYNVINSVGGEEGIRKGTLRYLNLPAAFKVHIIDLSFFKVSVVAGAGVAFLMDGQETISHNAAKLRFPPAVYPILPPDYEVEYDGVVSPQVENHSMLVRSDFNTLQYYVSAGFRSDWDVSEHWRVSFDLRANYGLNEPRTDSYLARLNSNQTIYDLPGKRRDIVAYFNVGIARYIDIDKKESDRKKNSKGSSKKFRAKKYPWPGSRSTKPKN